MIVKLPFSTWTKRNTDKHIMVPDDNELNWRHEWKYTLSVSDAASIRMRIQAIGDLDIYAREKGRYWVRSLYFDNYRNLALNEKINGTNPREKFRIRYYNLDPSRLFLEKKYKRGRLGTKFKETIDKATVQSILGGSLDLPLTRSVNGAEMKSPLLFEFSSKMRFIGLRPISVVDYIREPYEFEAGDVRVTFDYDLRIGWNIQEFLNPDMETIPATYPVHMANQIPLARNWKTDRIDSDSSVLYSRAGLIRPDSGTIPSGCSPVIMEVKWNHFIPEIVQDALSVPGLSAVAFSKYAHSRAFK